MRHRTEIAYVGTSTLTKITLDERILSELKCIIDRGTRGDSLPNIKKYIRRTSDCYCASRLEASLEGCGLAETVRNLRSCPDVDNVT